jgi:serine/threonine protein kinase
VYSIGIVLFEMLTGRLPYTGANQQELALAHIRDRVPLVTEFNPTVPEALASIIFKVMSKEPANRYRMADQLGNILEGYRERVNRSPSAGFQPVGAPPPPVQPPAAPPPVQQAPPPRTPPPPPPQQPLPGQIWPPPAQTPAPTPFAGESPVTQRIGLAPNAPVPPSYNRAPQPPGAYQGTESPFAPGAAPSEPLGGTGRYRSQPYQVPDEEPEGGLDVVTIALAILAFFAVACLIPLYIAVFQARFGG